MNSIEVRAELFHRLRRDLIGPSLRAPDGHDDSDLAAERLKDNPSRWYLTGFIAPSDDSEEIDALKHMAEIDVAKRLRNAEHHDQCGTEIGATSRCHDFLRCPEDGGVRRDATPDSGTRFLQRLSIVIPGRAGGASPESRN